MFTPILDSLPKVENYLTINRTDYYNFSVTQTPQAGEQLYLSVTKTFLKYLPEMYQSIPEKEYLKIKEKFQVHHFQMQGDFLHPVIIHETYERDNQTFVTATSNIKPGNTHAPYMLLGFYREQTLTAEEIAVHPTFLYRQNN